MSTYPLLLTGTFVDLQVSVTSPEFEKLIQSGAKTLAYVGFLHKAVKPWIMPFHWISKNHAEFRRFV